MTGGDLPAGDVPVFVFHSLEPQSFGRKLAHLDASPESWREALIATTVPLDAAVCVPPDRGTWSARADISFLPSDSGSQLAGTA